jgi:hypothetical protein
LRTVLNFQVVGQTAYFDLAGFRGRPVGLRTSPQKSKAKSTAKVAELQASKTAHSSLR